MGSFERKVSRNVLKKVQGNNRIKDQWKDFMNYKYSIGELQEMKRMNKKRRK